ncbi:DUF429 domain-containing protein [Nocardiopsis eucommiae]|uniref:DUF429 domain-containing protein n=1 Tax=Nocardiopsis eucommiae TaxID=2831970 RepID=A0A975LDH3_9ACTN|nr:DUF429 domain-containing protein [Nocardiopsis eucommiae]
MRLLTGLTPGDKAGIDCPFGWPITFTRAVHARAHLQPWPGRGLDHRSQYQAMRLRLTDQRVHQASEVRPLPVSFDKLRAVAARRAYLADALAAAGTPVNRSGVTGRVVEVYPAASRIMWGLGKNRDMAVLLGAAPRLECSAQVWHAYEASEHAFDALIAWAVAVGLTVLLEGEEAWFTREEGWIHLPKRGSLPALKGPGPAGSVKE